MARRHFPQLQPAPTSLFETASRLDTVSRIDAPCTLVISCDDCVMAGTDACSDCLVPFLLGDDAGSSPADPPATPSAGSTVDVDADEAATLRLLQQAGLAPELRHPRHAPVLAVLGGRG